MEDFKIVFYILVGIAYLVYQNYQKVKTNRPRQGNEQPVENTLSKKFEELVNKTKEELRRPEVTAIPVKNKPGKPVSRNTTVQLEASASKSLETLVDENASTASYFHKELNQTTIPNPFETEYQSEKTEPSEWKILHGEFNLRQAFIYSVIMQRPSY
ncbi:MAG: hypothetical protein ACHQNT_13110 [Bacteroidia bacterium]